MKEKTWLWCKSAVENWNGPRLSNRGLPSVSTAVPTNPESYVHGVHLDSVAVGLNWQNNRPELYSNRLSF
jgi:hypothetical protein